MKKVILASVVFASAMLSTGCSGPEPADETVAVQQPVSPLTAEEIDRVEALLKENICAECHGENLQGSETGPSLGEIREYWNEERLAEYLYHPQRYMVSHQKVQERSPGFEIDMPPYKDLSEEDRRLLARWVLEERE
jgi:cytochrome c551/c552